jgi:hypothetical protein
MLEAVVAVLLLFALGCAFCIGKKWESVENYLLRKDIQRLEAGIARERVLRIRAEKCPGKSQKREGGHWPEARRENDAQP